MIDLSECFGVTDHGVIGLVQKNPHISRVNVACTDIGDELLVTLASTCSTTLSYLNVALTNVTDQGEYPASIAIVVQCKQELWLSGNAAT